MNGNSELEKIVVQFETYEDYLDSLLTKDDVMFLEDKTMCRELLTLVSGYHSNKTIFPKESFTKKKAEIAAKIKQNQIKELKICSSGITCSDKLLQALAKREEDNLRGYVATVIFLRDLNEKGEEISGYIDYTQKLKSEDWELYFKEEKKLWPLKTDLSFYNWTKDVSFHNSGPYFDVIADIDAVKLTFICRNDGYALNVEQKVKNDENTYRHDIMETSYLQAVIFDHVVDKPLS